MPRIRGNKSLQINKRPGSVLGVGIPSPRGRQFERAHQTSFSLLTPVVNDKGRYRQSHATGRAAACCI